MHEALDVRRLGDADEGVLGDGRGDVRGVQECRAFQPHVDEGGLHAGQHALHAALVQIADDAAPALTLDEQLHEHAVLDERGAVLAWRDVDEDLDGHRTTPAPRHTGIPAARSISAVSYSGSPMTPV